MTEQVDKLRALVRELENELQAVQDLDDQANEDLQVALQDVLLVLHARQQVPDEEAAEPPAIETPPPPDSPIEQLKQSAREFEGSHPTLSGILLRLVDGLGQMGI